MIQIEVEEREKNMTEKDNREEEKKLDTQKKSGMFLKYVYLLIPIAIILVILASVIFILNKGDGIEDKIIGTEGKVVTVSESTLTEVIHMAKLETVEYPYSGYTKVEKDGKIQYYVAYAGTVKAGIDFSNVRVVLDEEEHKIIIKMPEVEIYSPNVDVESIDEIFVNKKAETETVMQEIYRAAEEDMKLKVDEIQNEFKTMAEDNAKNSLKALTQPWVEQIFNENYEIEIITEGE